MKHTRIFVASALSYLLFIMTPDTIFGQGSVQNITFFSSSLGASRNVQIYLPQGYNPSDTTVRYPVICFLHGAGGNHTSYSFLISILDQLISAQTIQPTIVVKPDGSVPPYAGSFYTNSALYGLFEDYIVDDVVAYVDSAYNTIRNKSKRSIMGHSMGAYGSMKAALKHPDIYRGVAAHSGPLDFNHLPDALPYILAESGGSPPYTYNPGNGTFSFLTFSIAGAFSPNLSNPPYLVDFPFDSLGNVIDTVIARWLVQNPARLAASLPSDSNLAIYFDCGMQDELTLFAWNTGFRDSLDLLSLPYRFLPYTGNHGNQLPNRFPIALRFLDSVMHTAPTAVHDVVSPVPSSFVLYQNYPNPFNPSTTIRFSLSQSDYATLKVFTLLGEEVATLVSQKLSPGTYGIEWNAAGMASGVYFYRLNTNEHTQTRTMLIVR